MKFNAEVDELRCNIEVPLHSSLLGRWNRRGAEGRFPQI